MGRKPFLTPRNRSNEKALFRGFPKKRELTSKKRFVLGSVCKGSGTAGKPAYQLLYYALVYFLSLIRAFLPSNSRR
jgi:hypothetical protein